MADISLQAELTRPNPFPDDTAFRLVCDMEDPLRKIRDLLSALSYVAQCVEDGGEAIATIADAARENLKAAEALRGDLFRLSHPNRAVLEKEGWPA